MYLVQHRSPIPEFGLTEQLGGFVPGAGTAFDLPPPVGAKLEQDPSLFSYCSCQMRNRCIDGYHQIRALKGRGRVVKISEIP